MPTRVCIGFESNPKRSAKQGMVIILCIVPLPSFVKPFMKQTLFGIKRLKENIFRIYCAQSQQNSDMVTEVVELPIVNQPRVAIVLISVDY